MEYEIATVSSRVLDGSRRVTLELTTAHDVESEYDMTKEEALELAEKLIEACCKTVESKRLRSCLL